MKIVYGILTFIVGFVIMFIIAGFLGSSGGGSQLTNSSFNSGIIALCVSILFLCAVLVVCTLMVVNAIKDK